MLLQIVSQGHPVGRDGQDQAGAGSDVDLDEVGNLPQINVNGMNNLYFTNFTINGLLQTSARLSELTRSRETCWISLSLGLEKIHI